MTVSEIQKKIILFLLILIFIALSCSGCKLFDSVEDSLDYEMQVWVDKKTGVNYYIYVDEDRFGITPRLDKNGKVMITKKGVNNDSNRD